MTTIDANRTALLVMDFQTNILAMLGFGVVFFALALSFTHKRLD